eukprot:TRINITY_DN1019_c0_g3_i2.p1 TRINITY_DN1019_c0_g3~~TRINITY_DN1019_c0_g3_i2.p1  ORF type:complete len:380 (-),score=49.88 TRINITY_DN1019_c0_g3_i2:421-1560(-)
MANLGHGGNVKAISREKNLKYEDIIDFSANINPLGISSNVKREIIKNIDEIEKYPDISYFELKKSIGEYEDIDMQHIVLGNGAAEVLFNIVKAINPKKTLLLAPTFSEYEEAINSVNGDIDFYYLKEENKFEIKEDILENINNKINLIVICNPNNPTGVLSDRVILEKVLAKAKQSGIIVLLDESFLDFIIGDYSMISYIKQYDNLIIVKSLTKFFALPGLRMGYAICINSKQKEKIEYISPAWNINSLAEIATKVALKDKKYINRTIEYIKEEKEFLYNELQKIKKIKVFNPSVNFIFLKLNCNLNLKEQLIKSKILIRSCSNYRGIDDRYYRVAVRTHEDNVLLVNRIKEILNNGQLTIQKQQRYSYGIQQYYQQNK